MNENPSDAQKKAGNYAKEHRSLAGMRISIENKAGSTRRGVGEDGTPWESTMAHDYGYVRGSKGKDKDHLDVFLGPEADNRDHPVYVIDQNKPDGSFDEHKALIGFPSANDAYEAYHENYPAGHNGFHAITELPLAGFRKWAGVGAEGGKRKRISELAGIEAYRKGGVVAKAGGAGEARTAPGVEPVPAGAQPFAAGGLVAKALEEGLPKLLKLWHGGADVPTSELKRSPAGVLYGAPEDKRWLAEAYARQERPGIKTGKLHQLEFYDPVLADDGVIAKAARRIVSRDDLEDYESMPQVLLDAGVSDTALKLREKLQGMGYNGTRGFDDSPFGTMFQNGAPLVGESIGVFPNARTRPITKADGGSVEEDLSRPAFRTPLVGRRRADRQDREGAKDAPLQVLRGMLTGTLGFGGDLEGLGRTVAKAAGADVDATPTLPTSEFYSDVLPLRPTSATGRAAAGVGNALGVPLSSAALGGVRAASKIAPTARGALSTLAENAMAPKELGSQAGALRIGKSTPILELLNELGLTHLRPDFEEMTHFTNTNGREAGGENLARGRGLPWAKGDDTSVSVYPVDNPAYESIVNAHTHPTDHSLFPSSPGNTASAYGANDLSYWARKASHLDEDHALHGFVLRASGKNDDPSRMGPYKIGYNYRSIPGGSPAYEPEVMGEAMHTLQRALKSGDFVPAIRNAIERTGGNAMDDAAVRNGVDFLNTSTSFLPHAYFDTVPGLSNGSAFDIARDGSRDWGNRLLEEAWPTARKILSAKKPGGYAAGGAITGEETVGLGTFSPSRQGATTQPANANPSSGGRPGSGSLLAPVPGQSGAPLGGASFGNSSADWSNPMYGQLLNGGNAATNPGPLGKNSAPTYSTRGLDAFMSGDPSRLAEANTMDPALKMAMTAGGKSGMMSQGIGALMGAAYRPTQTEITNAPGEFVNRDDSSHLWNVANQVGFDPSQYQHVDDSTAEFYRRQGYNMDDQPKGVGALTRDLGNATKDLYGISGMSSGWTGSGDPRGSSATLYRRQGEQLVPITAPRNFSAPRTGNWWKSSNGREFLTALSMVMPAVGGYAGLVGQAGSAYAPAINAAGSAAVGGATGGTQGALTSLAGSLGGAGGSALGDAAGGYGAAGQQLGSAAGKYIAGQRR